MKFALEKSLEENLSLFKTAAEKLDADCARILFENIHILRREGDISRDREAVSAFHKAVLQALDEMPSSPESPQP